jgi:Zyg-11 family protein
MLLTFVQGEVVVKWKTSRFQSPVSHSTFRPFFPLLTCHEAFQVQLWAVWAIQHVCTKNGIVYIKF